MKIIKAFQILRSIEKSKVIIAKMTLEVLLLSKMIIGTQRHSIAELMLGTQEVQVRSLALRE